MSELIKYNKTDDLVQDAVQIVDASRQNAYRAVNTALIQRNWLLGKRITEETLGSQSRDERYGNQVVQNLANELTERYGKGFDFSSLYKYVRFYQGYPNILETVSPKSFLLSWSHYLTLLQVDDQVARDWYEKEAAEQTWSVRTLQRNISSQYYYRLLASQHQDVVEKEMQQLSAPSQNDKYEFIKNPVVAEFLGLEQNTDFTESTLEKAIISNL